LRPGRIPVSETTVDLVYILVMIAFFAVTLVLVRGLERLRKRS
jgi:hypothetical protein